jgi:hypothetical protein
MNGIPAPTFQLPSTTISQPQPQAHPLAKPSKGIKAYPDGWRKVLGGAKDVVRGSVLIRDPFPSANLARITVNEAFHEVLASECNINGLVLEPGMSPSKINQHLMLTSIQDTRGARKWSRL